MLEADKPDRLSYIGYFSLLFSCKTQKSYKTIRPKLYRLDWSDLFLQIAEELYARPRLYKPDRFDIYLPEAEELCDAARLGLYMLDRLNFYLQEAELYEIAYNNLLEARL